MKKNIKHIILLITLFFAFSYKCMSLTYGGCEYSQISRLKSLVSNVNLSYDYNVINNTVYFNVTINNLVPEVYFIDSHTGKTYYYSDSLDGEIVIKNYQNISGDYKFYSALNQCYGVKLGNKYYTFPSYNYHYETTLCQENKNFSLCQKWIKVNYTYDELKEIIDEYNEKKNFIDEDQKIDTEYKETYLDILVKIYIKYYYFILIGIIVICVILMIINKKKNSFDL
jgi:hypothetical protein